MSKTEACFVPSYVASNISDDEFVAMMRDCLPGPVVERMCELENSVPAEAFDACMKARKAVESIEGAFEKADIDLAEPPDFAAMTIAEAKAMFDKLTEVCNQIHAGIASATEALDEVTG